MENQLSEKAQQNLARFQEIANRGLQDRLDADKRARFDEAVKRGLITLPKQFQEPIQPAPQRELTAFEKADQALLEIPGMRTLAEFAASANKGFAGILDFLGPDTANAALELAGSDYRVPTVAQGIESVAGSGNFMEPGFGRDVVQASGQLLPTALGMGPVVGRDVTKLGGAAAELVGLGTAKAAAPIKAATSAVSDALPSKAKDAAKLPLYRQSGDIAAAGFKLDDAGRVVADKIQQKAIKAGVDEGAVAMIAAANKATKSRLKEMVEVLEKGKGNLEFRNFNPPQRVIGQAIKDRLSVIQSANRQAASELDGVVEGIKRKPVDVAPAINTFLDDLSNQGIRFNPRTGAVSFADSTIEGLDGAQSIIRRTINRLYNTNDPTLSAYRVHNAKKFLDEQVSYGKTQEGLSGTMQTIIKRLRHNLDGILDSNFPEYDRVNTVYSETRSVIDELQSLAGRKVDLTGDKVDKALGVMSRKVLSNYNTGTATEDLFEQLDEVAKRYSTPLNHAINDELKKLVSAEAELRKMFPTASKPNTFQGLIGSEVGRAAADAATGNKIGLMEKAAKAAGRVFSKSDEEKIQAIKDLLAE